MLPDLFQVAHDFLMDQDASPVAPTHKTPGQRPKPRAADETNRFFLGLGAPQKSSMWRDPNIFMEEQDDVMYHMSEHTFSRSFRNDSRAFGNWDFVG